MKNFSFALFSFCFCLSVKSFSQHYSHGLTKEGKLMRNYSLKVVDTDPITGFAKESAPFDRPFFIKIRRLPSGLPAARPKDTIQPIEPPSTIKKIELLITTSSDASEIELQSVKFESDTSDTIIIPIQNLRPVSNYILIVTWMRGGAVGENVVERFSITTNEDSLGKRLGQRIVPQFGVAGGFFRYNSELSYRPSLMLGIYYHFRPINQDIPMRAYHPFAVQRFSLLGGVTLTTFAVEKVRANLFGSNNLMLGVGYQPYDAIRLSYGALFFNEINPNPGLSADKAIKSTAYLSITLDIKLKDILGGIFTTLGFK